VKRMEMTVGNYAACVSDPPDKTQTRRVMNPQPSVELLRPQMSPFVAGFGGLTDWTWQRDAAGEIVWPPRIVGLPAPSGCGYAYKPRYAVGDIVALTLPHWRQNHPDGLSAIFDTATRVDRFRDQRGCRHSCTRTLDNTPDPRGGWKRMAARYMPVWACLHFAEIVGVRAERLGEITWNDAIEEGCYASGHVDPDYLWRWPGQPREADGYASPLEAYAREWEALHGAGAWDPDEWVSVYDFKLCERPEDTHPPLLDGRTHRELQGRWGEIINGNAE